MARSKYKCKTLTLPNGDRKYIYGKTKEELDRKYQQARLELNAGVDLQNKDTFGEFAQMWFNTFKMGKVSNATAYSMKANMNSNIMPMLAKYKMKDITPMMCQSVFSEMAKQGKVRGTQKISYNIMRQIFSVAHENGVIYKSPITESVSPIGEPSRKRRSLSDTQIEEVLAAAKNKYVENIVIVGLYTGMRIGEILGIMWDDVDMDRGEINVRHNVGMGKSSSDELKDHLKTQCAERTIPFGKEVRRVFDRLEQDKNGKMVFHDNSGRMMYHTKVYNMWKDLRNTSYGPSLSPHILRHTAITRWIEMGLDVKEVQYLAGHSTASITLDVYADYVSESRYEETRKKLQSETEHARVSKMPVPKTYHISNNSVIADTNKITGISS